MKREGRRNSRGDQRGLRGVKVKDFTPLVEQEQLYVLYIEVVGSASDFISLAQGALMAKSKQQTDIK